LDLQLKLAGGSSDSIVEFQGWCCGWWCLWLGCGMPGPLSPSLPVWYGLVHYSLHHSAPRHSAMHHNHHTTAQDTTPHHTTPHHTVQLRPASLVPCPALWPPLPLNHQCHRHALHLLAHSVVPECRAAACHCPCTDVPPSKCPTQLFLCCLSLCSVQLLWHVHLLCPITLMERGMAWPWPRLARLWPGRPRSGPSIGHVGAKIGPGLGQSWAGPELARPRIGIESAQTGLVPTRCLGSTVAPVRHGRPRFGMGGPGPASLAPAPSPELGRPWAAEGQP